ncbi:MAG: NAD(P)/FAD-dependent oxidoreductase [Terriglobia bacterium]|jgi:flavin-dependent dehydrogenase
MSPEFVKTDVFVVGGGPAGLAAAIAARQKGLRVVVADFAEPPIDKACGEGLMPNTVAALKQLGVTLGSEKAIPFHGIRFVEAGTSAEAAFPQGYGLGIRRTILHKVLVERAVAAGVQCLWKTRVTGLRPGEFGMDSDKIPSRWIIGADGQNSQVRKWAGLDRGRPSEIRYGFRQHFCVTPWSDFVEVHWGGNCQIVVTPVGPREMCLVVTSRWPQLRPKAALTQFPEISRRLEGRPTLTKDLGAISALRVVRNVCRGPLALIGDASGSVDSLTGEGPGLAFLEARALAEALANQDLASYQAAHRVINRGAVLMSRLLLAMEGHAWLRRRVLSALANEPQLFARFLAVQVGAFSPGDLGIGNVLKLGRGLLTSPS